MNLFKWFGLVEDKYVYYDYICDEIFLSPLPEFIWPTGCGDYNLVYLGEL